MCPHSPHCRVQCAGESSSSANVESLNCGKFEIVPPPPPNPHPISPQLTALHFAATYFNAIMLMVACSVVTTILVSSDNHYQWRRNKDKLLGGIRAEIFEHAVEIKKYLKPPHVVSVAGVCSDVMAGLLEIIMCINVLSEAVRPAGLGWLGWAGLGWAGRVSSYRAAVISASAQPCAQPRQANLIVHTTFQPWY